MLSKCANPLCAAPFRYLHEGRIFNFEIEVASVDSGEMPMLRIEHFWLCGRCIQTLRIVLDHGVVTTRPLHLELPEGTTEEKLEPEPMLT
jgi:hypothetical protein